MITFPDRSVLAAAQHSVSISTFHKEFLFRLMYVGADRAHAVILISSVSFSGLLSDLKKRLIGSIR